MSTNRHPDTEHLLSYFTSDHLPPALQMIAGPCQDLAYGSVANLPDSPELLAGLRKLLEAKDCFVRAKVDAMRAEADVPKNSPEPFLTGDDG